MRTVLAFSLLVAVSACDGRAIGVVPDGSPPASSDSSAAIPIMDLASPSDAFCAGGPRLMIDGELILVSRVESGPIYMGCCDGWFARFVAHRSTGQEVRVTFSFRWAGGRSPPPPQHFDLAKSQGNGGMGFYVECDPASECGVLNPFDAVFAGTLDTTPTGAFPGYYIDLCLSATPKDTAQPNAKPVRLSARHELIVLTNPQCDWGKDQTCNQDPWISSFKGKCNGDGTCTCVEGAKKVPNTGKCQ